MNTDNSIKRIQQLRFIFITFLSGVLLYNSFLSMELNNHLDGLWSSELYYAGEWEISIGRWFWPLLNFIARGYAADPLNSYVTLFMIAVACYLIMDLFSVTDRLAAYFYSFLIISSIGVCCWLSYRYMSPTFGLSFLLSSLAVWILYKRPFKYKGVILGAIILTCLMLALYQANLGVICGLVVIMAVWDLMQSREIKGVFGFIILSACSVLIGIIVYKVIWDLILSVMNIEPASYQGANQASFAHILKELPHSLLHAYQEFHRYFLSNSLRHNIFQTTKFAFVYYCAAIALVAMVILGAIVKNGISAFGKCLALLLLILLPPACNAALLMAPSTSISAQMTGPLIIIIPVMMIIAVDLWKTIFQEGKWKRTIVELLTGAFLAFFLFGSTLMTGFDIEAMREGKLSSEAIMNNIVTTLIQRGEFDKDQKYVFFGSYANNPLFHKSELWNRANGYAKYGANNSSDHITRMTHEGVLDDIGVEVPIGDETDLANIRQSGILNDMSNYPAAGSIREYDGMLVVKISD